MRGKMVKAGKLGKICCRFLAVCSLVVLVLCWLPGPVYATGSDMVVYETGMEDVVIRGTGELFYAVEHEGSGKGTMAVTGNATGAYEVVVKIVKGGVLGEAQFQISLDGGQSFIGQDTVSESSMIGGAGITLQFATEQDTDEFVQGDIFHARIPETFPVSASEVGETNLIVTGHPLEAHEFTVTILSSGSLGGAKFAINSQSGREIRVTDVLPLNGCYTLQDDMELIFSDSNAYERGMTYSVTVKSNDKSINYTPLYILFGAAAVGVTAALSLIGSKKETDRLYRIRRYRWQKEEREYGV